jgi:hypothetical protein
MRHQRLTGPHANSLGRIAVSLLAVLLTTLMATQIAFADAPDSSGVVSHFHYWDDGFYYYDEADGLTALIGPEDLPPEQGCVGEGFDDPLVGVLVQMPSGATKLNIRQGATHVGVYDMTLPEICQTAIGGGTVEPLYAGWMSTVYNENNVGAGHARAALGTSSHGIVWDGDGSRCVINAHDRAQITPDGEFNLLVSDINIVC